MKDYKIIFFLLWGTMEWEDMFMEDNITGRENFITLKIINPIILLIKRKTKKYATTSSLIKFMCG